MLTGIDVSQWQGPDPQMDADVIGIKASEGMGGVNRDFAAQVAKARRGGKRVQLYHYSWPAQDVGAELENFSTQIGPVLLPGDVLVLDWEWYPPSNLPTDAQAAAYKAAWLDMARKRWPDHRVILYTNAARWNDKRINPDKAMGDGLWIAHYGVPQGKPGITEAWIGHQWQGAPLDRSVWAFEDVAAYDRWANPAPSDPQTPEGVPMATTFRGKPCCSCCADWFPVFEQLALQRGLVTGPIWLIQATGSAPASAGTHAQGGAMDIGVMRHDLVKLAREMGASASWVRNTGSFATNQHSHLVLDGCPHNTPARYQITAVKAGFDGLGSGGRGGKDPEYRPPQWRTWTQGLAWARTQLTPDPIREWDDMATEAQIKQAVKDGINDVLWTAAVPGQTGVPGSSWRNNALWVQNKLDTLTGVVRELAGRAGVDVDESAIASQVAAAVGPLLRDAVLAAIREGGEPETVANAVVAKLGVRLGTIEAVK